MDACEVGHRESIVVGLPFDSIMRRRLRFVGPVPVNS
jgi:hypothetical protein